MQKKVFLLGIFAILLISFFGLVQGANADSSDANIDSKTIAEIKEMNVNYGANMRLLQLKYSLQRAIFHAEKIIVFLNSKGKDTTELVGIKEELIALKEEVSEMIPVSEPNQETINEFIEIKRKAKELIAEFKTKARELLTNEEISELKKNLATEENREELKQTREQAREEKNKLNALKVRMALTKMGKTDEEFVNKIENGQLTKAEIATMLRTEYSSLSEEEKARLREQVRTESQQRIQNIQANVAAYNRVKTEIAQAKASEIAARLEKAGTTAAFERASNIRNRIRTSSGGANAD